MEYSITPSKDGTYIILKVKGNITRNSAMEMNLEAHALGRQLHIRRYLVDVTEARNVEFNTENYQFAYTDLRKTEGIDKHARVVTLVSPDDHSHDFIETVSRNAGFNLRLFTDLRQAKRFLMDEDSPDAAPADDENAG